MTDTDWQNRANCRGLPADLFFPARGESTTEARAVCAGRVVRDQCLEYALTNRLQFGMWGGRSERERRRMRRGRNAEARAS